MCICIYTHAHPRTYISFYTLLFPFLNLIFCGWYFWIVSFFSFFLAFRLLVIFSGGSGMKVNKFFTFFKKLIQTQDNHGEMNHLQTQSSAAALHATVKTKWNCSLSQFYLFMDTTLAATEHSSIFGAALLLPLVKDLDYIALQRIFVTSNKVLLTFYFIITIIIWTF